jgi:hypothetical protein
MFEKDLRMINSDTLVRCILYTGTVNHENIYKVSYNTINITDMTTKHNNQHKIDHLS